MNVLNHCGDEQVECPLCMEPFEVDDLNFYPCTCGYQICRFCWHRIRTDENELCPACRKAYPENPADFTPLSQEQISQLKAEKRQRDQQRKQKITENRKHLANVRVVQKNLVFVVGLPHRLADPEILKKHEYFGKYGKIHKVVINPSTAYAGAQGPSASAYVTYVHNNDALRAIQSVNNIMINGRSIKTSLGTTKYCSHFMKNQSCPKPDCMYLHDLGDQEASFTKEEMHQGKHQEYEKRLHETLIAQSQQTDEEEEDADTKQESVDAATPSGGGGGTGKPASSQPIAVPKAGGEGKPDAWPSLSVSPTDPVLSTSTPSSQQQSASEVLKTTASNTKPNNKENTNRKHDKTRGDKSKENNPRTNGRNSTAKDKEAAQQQKQQDQHQQQQNKLMSSLMGALDDDEDELENDASSEENDGGKTSETPSLSRSSDASSNGGNDSGTASESASGKSTPGGFPDHPNQNQSESYIELSSEDTINKLKLQQQQQQQTSIAATTTATTGPIKTDTTQATSSNGGPTINSIDKLTTLNSFTQQDIDTTSSLFSNNNISSSKEKLNNINPNNNNNLNGMKLNNLNDTSARFSKLGLFDDNSSFFSHNSFHPYYKADNNGITSLGHTDVNQHLLSANNTHHLPDLLNGLGENTVLPSSQSLNTTEDWEAAFKFVMMRNNNKHIDDQEEFIRMQEVQKRNMLNGLGGMPQQPQPPYTNSFNEYNSDYFHNNPNDMNRMSGHSSLLNQQRGGHIFVNKFFDFHKNQQQQQQTQQQFLLNGGDQLTNMSNILDANRMNPHFLDQQQLSNGLMNPQMQQKSRLLNKYDQVNGHSNLVLNNQQQQQQQQQSRLHQQFTPQSSSIVDDDLGFDPFIETQKALAELMHDEMIQTQNNHKLLENNQQQQLQRPRMPPPGFNVNHMNTYGGFQQQPPATSVAQGSKIMPFMNNMGQLQQPQPQSSLNNWQHMGYPPNDSVPLQQNGLHGKPGYGSNYTSDWTSYDPAIALSFRQFPSFMNGQQQNPQPNQQSQPQQPNTDLFLTQMNQQQPQQSNPGFGLANMMNQQPNSPPQQQPQQPQQKRIPAPSTIGPGMRIDDYSNSADS